MALLFVDEVKLFFFSLLSVGMRFLVLEAFFCFQVFLLALQF